MACEEEMRPRVLVVEDDAAISDVVFSALTQEGYACRCAYSGTEALMIVESGEEFDVVLCDLMLPGASGEEVIAALRARGTTPVIVASAKGEVADRVALLRMGADDYLVKPFDLDELIARVEALLRRAHAAGADAACVPEASALSFGQWCLDEDARTFSVAGSPVRLTRTEFDILAALMHHPKKVFTKRELFEIARNEEALADERTINTHMSNMRAKLKETGTDVYLETVWGIGFKLADIEAAVRR